MQITADQSNENAERSKHISLDWTIESRKQTLD